jgi:hypothetical protein
MYAVSIMLKQGWKTVHEAQLYTHLCANEIIYNHVTVVMIMVQAKQSEQKITVIFWNVETV